MKGIILTLALISIIATAEANQQTPICTPELAIEVFGDYRGEFDLIGLYEENYCELSKELQEKYL